MEGSPGCCWGAVSITDGVWNLWGHGAAWDGDLPGTARSSRAGLKVTGQHRRRQGCQAGHLHTRLKCSAPRGAAFLWHPSGLSPRAEHPRPELGWGRGPMGICSCGSLQQPPTQDLPAGRRKASLAQPAGSASVCSGQEPRTAPCPCTTTALSLAGSGPATLTQCRR